MEDFLVALRRALAEERVHFAADRDKNLEFRLRHLLTKEDILLLLGELQVEEYAAGPEPDDKKRPGDIWIFGIELSDTLVYIKIRDRRPKKHPAFFCISFHEADWELTFPFHTGAKE